MNEELFEKYFTGQLSGKEAGDLKKYLESGESARQTFARHAAERAALVAVAEHVGMSMEDEGSEAPRPLRRWPVLVVAASVLFLIGLAGIAVHYWNSTSPVAPPEMVNIDPKKQPSPENPESPDTLATGDLADTDWRAEKAPPSLGPATDAQGTVTVIPSATKDRILHIRADGPVTLTGPCGSTLELAETTELHLPFKGDDPRRVRLAKGFARAQIERWSADDGKPTPFVISSAAADIVVTGTEFTARLDERKQAQQEPMVKVLEVKLLSGNVQLKNPFGKLEMEAGDEATASETSAPTNSFLQKAIRKSLGKPAGELTADDLQRVTTLVLDDPYITDASLSELVRLPSLASLYLGFNGRVSDAGLAYVARCPKLSTLSLDFTKTTDVGLKEVARLKGLTCLGLSNTHVTEEGVDKLKQELPACVVLRVQTRGGGKATDMYQVLSAWAQENPQAVAAWMRSIKDWHRRFDVMSDLSKAYASKDPENAAKWALSLKGEQNGNIFFGAVHTVLDRWTEADPAKAAAWAESLDADRRIGYHACKRVARVLAKRDPAKAAAWARSIKDHEPRLQALSEVGWTEEDLRREEESARAIQDKGRLLDDIVRGWALKDPQKAEALARSLVDEKARSNALFYLAITWPEKYPEKAESLARSFEDKEERTTALTCIAGTFADTQRFKDAIRVAESIEDRGARSERLRYVLGKYYEADPVAAKAWVKSLPANDQKQLQPVLDDLENPPWRMRVPEEDEEL